MVDGAHGGAPTLSLSLPVYNGARYLAETLDNIRESELEDWVLTISDNASTDDTAEIAEKFCALDDRIRYVRQAHNIGAAPNHNAAFRTATGEFHAWVQWDNLYRPSYFRRCVETLRRRPDVTCVHAATGDIDGTGRELAVWDEGLRTDDPDPVVRFRDLTERDHMVFQFFGVVRRDVLARTSLHASFDSADRLLVVELALRGPVVMLDDVLFLHREHPHRMMNTARSARAVYPMLDPTWSGRVPFPILNIGRQYLRAVARSPLSRRDTLRCVLAMRGWLRTNWLRCLRTVGRGGLEYAKLLTVERGR